MHAGGPGYHVWFVIDIDKADFTCFLQHARRIALGVESYDRLVLSYRDLEMAKAKKGIHRSRFQPGFALRSSTLGYSYHLICFPYRERFAVWLRVLLLSFDHVD
ncbi:hypothetical protein TWF694_007525 [Orbilia ellipsospora]|uniref:DNA primase small subunit n=1 Tax=Orbilia ellipsospora TaxID=2528407 RepID=A0AAV9XHZ4_9PEZI